MPLHPALFAIYPALLLLSSNATYATFADAGRSFAVSLFVVSAVWLSAWLALRNANKAAAFTTWLWLVFFAPYRLVFHLDASEAGWLAAVVVAVWLAGAAWLVFTRSSLVPVTKALNVAAVGLVCGNVIAIGGQAVPRLFAAPPPAPAAVHLTAPAKPPDVYYIILDAYARDDVLRDLYAHDNTWFLDALRERGFVISHSYANYPQTLLSLASSLNFRYLDALRAPDARDDDRVWLRDRIAGAQVPYTFRALGYEILDYDTGYNGALIDADKHVKNETTLNEFERSLWQTTEASYFAERAAGAGGREETTAHVTRSDHDSHRRRVLENLASLARRAPGRPRFVFLHLLSPHPPFVFDAQGGPVPHAGPFHFADGSHLIKTPADQAEYRRLYAAQITYLNARVLDAVDQILATAETPPIVILQGDHGPASSLDWEDAEKSDLRERFGILSAYHLPGGGASAVYDGISPVNTFRVVFNSYFGARLPLLPDRSFFATWTKPGVVTDVTSALPPYAAGD